MPLIQLLTNEKGEVIGIRRVERSTARQVFTSVTNAYTFGRTQGASLEVKRLTYATLVTQSTALTEQQKDEIRRQVLSLTIHDQVHLVAAQPGDEGVLLKPVAVGGDQAKQLPQLIKIFVDP